MKKITILLKAAFLILFLLSSTAFYAQIDFDGDNCEPHSLTGVNHASDDNDVGNIPGTSDIMNFWLDQDNGNLYLSFDRGASGTSSYVFYFNTDCSIENGDNTASRKGSDWAAFFTWSGNGSISDNKLYEYVGGAYIDSGKTFTILVGESICFDTTSENQFAEMEISTADIGLDLLCACNVIDLTEGNSLAGGFGSAVKDLFDPTGFSIEINNATATNDGPKCEGETITLNETGGAAVSWVWENVSGTATIINDNTATASVSNAVNGEIFKVTITDTYGCEFEDTTTVSVYPEPTATASNSGPVCYDVSSITLNETGGDAVSWSWDSDGSATITNTTDKNPTVTGFVNGEKFTVTITDANECTSIAETTVTVYSDPTATASNSGPVCYDVTSITLNETGGDAVSWSWDSDGSATITNTTDKNPTVTGFVNGEKFTVTITDANECTSIAETTVTVYSEPTATASNSGPVCYDVTSITANEAGGDAVSWSWTSSGSAVFNTATSQNPTVTGFVNGEILTVNIIDANGCTSSDTTTVVVDPEPTATASNSGPVCYDVTSITANEAGGDAVSWSWTSSGSAVFNTATSQNPTVTGYVNGEILTVNIIDANGCTSSDTTTVVVDPEPQVSASSNSPVCLGDNISLTSTFTSSESSTSAESWSWSGPNGFNSNLEDPTEFASTSSASGIYTVQVTDNNGCVNSVTTSVTVNPLPEVSITGSDLICIGATTSLSPTTGGTWVSNSPLVATVTDEGEVTAISFGSATFTFTSTATCSSTTLAVTVADDESPVVTCPVVANTARTTDAGACTYTVVDTEFDATATDNCLVTSLSYALTGVTTGTGTNLSGVVFNKGVTTVTWTASDGINANDSCNFTVTVTDNEDPTITCPGNIVVNNDVGINGAVVNYTVTSSDNCPGEIISQTDTTGLSSGDTFPKGVTTLEYTVTDSSNNTATCSFTVTVNDSEDPVIECVSSDQQRNANEGVTTYTAVGTEFDPVSFGDNAEGATISNDYNDGATLAGAIFPQGENIVVWTVTDSSNNTATCTFTVTVNDSEDPVIECVSSDQQRNANEGVTTYTAVGTEFDPVSFGDNAAGATISNDYNDGATLAGAIFPQGSTTVIWTVTDSSNNTATCTFTVTVLLSPVAEDDEAVTDANIAVEIDILANDTDADGTIDPGSVTVVNSPTNGTVVVNTDGSVIYTPDLDFIGVDSFEYEVCDNHGLCDNAVVTVVVAGVLGEELIIPEGFSPNDDGVHDLFDVEGLANLYPDFSMVIYNRWGVVVYDYRHNGDPGETPVWWDGYSRGRMTMGSNKLAPVGTYFYTLHFNKDNARPRSGFLYLNR